MESISLNNSNTLNTSTLDAIRSVIGKKKKKKRKSNKTLKKSIKPEKKSVSLNKSKPLPVPPPTFPENTDQVPNIIIQTGEGPENFNHITNLKDKLTDKELRFISYYLTGDHNQISAMNLAGYKHMNDRYKQLLASQIIQRYESQVDDHRKIARAIGAGEVFVIRTLYDLAKNGKSERIRGDSAMNLAKILGMTKEQLEGAGGITIIFEGEAPAPARTLPGAPPMATAPLPAALPFSNKPLQITK